MIKIAFVTDGGPEMGMGHVQQSLTLAQELKDKGEIFFLTKSDKTIVSHIQNSGFDVIRRISDDELFDVLSEITPQLVIIDKIDVPEDFAKKIKEELTAKLAIFTNITPANKYADIAVTADYGSHFKNITFFDEKTKTLYYYGPRYWILRREFYKLKKRVKRVPDKIERILLIFGGSDPLNITSAVLEELLELRETFLVDVILGSGFKFISELNHVLQKHAGKGKNVNVLRNIQNIAEMMVRADLVMASPGLSLFEALSVGTPVVAMHQNALQADAYRGYIPTIDKSEINKLSNIINERTFIDPYDEFIANLEIGQGKEELIEVLLDGIMEEVRDSEMGKERITV